MLKRSFTIGLLGIAALASACGGGSSPAAPTASGGFLVTALSAQIADDPSGSHTYTLTYSVHNGDSAAASITDIDTALSASGSPLASFTSHYTGLSVTPGAQSQNTFAVQSAAGTPRANSVTVTIHYDEGTGPQQITRTAALQ